MTSLFNIFTSLEDSIYKITNTTNTGNEKKNKNSDIRAYNNPDNSLHATSLHQGKQFKKYQDKIINKNKKNIYKVNSREGFQGSNPDGSSSSSSSSSSQTQSQQVLTQTAISPEDSDNVKQLYIEQKVLVDKHKKLMTDIDSSTVQYFARTSKKNPYLNRIIVFTTGHCCYVTNQGVVRYIPSWDTYYSTGAPKELPNKLIYLKIPLPNDFWTPGTVVPTKPPLISGPNIVQNQSLGHEGNTVFVDRMVQNPRPSYSGCYADNQSQSLMTFIGGAPPSTTATIVNGNFTEPALSNDSYVYYASNDTTDVPGWTFNACIINNSSAWGYVMPYPEGDQAACIQGVSNMSQIVSMVSGSTYTLAFYATGRPSPYASGPVDIQLNGDTIYSFTPPTSSWQSYSVPINATVTGNNTLNFVGTTNDADYSTAIQYITLGTDASSSSGGTYSFQDCQTAAINLGYQYFGLQNVNSTSGLGYCAVSNNQVSATSLGTSNIATSTTVLWSSGTNGSDPGVSAKLTNTGSIVVYDSAGTAIYTSPGASQGNYWGCYGDGADRAIANYGSSNGGWYTYSTCQQEAQDGGYSYFGLQYVQSSGEGQCFYGNDVNEARVYGTASNCTSVNGDTYGGGWSNAVYGINPGVDFFLYVQDDGNLCLYRGQSPSDNQGSVWCSGTNGKTLDANPQYQATNGLYGLSYLRTNDTLAPGDFIGNTDGSAYLIMQTDGNLVLYTSTMGLNCSTINSTTSSSKSNATPMGGGQYATALYEFNGPPGIPGEMGQIGYVDKDSNLYKFSEINQQCSTNYNSATPTNNQPGQTNGQQYTCPKEEPVCKNYRQNIQWGTCSNIELTDKYTKISGTDSGGSDYIDVSGNYIAYSNTTVEDCQKTCNSYNDCYGFAFSNGSCYPKTNLMSYSGTDSNTAVDLYTRNKRIANPPAGVPKEITPISTTEYSNYNYIGNIGSDSYFGLGNANSVQKQMLSQLEDQINSVSSQINQFTGAFSQKDGVVQKQTGKNIQNLARHKKELDDAKEKIGVLQDVTLGNFERIIEDTDIRVLQESYTYMFWSILAITFVLITMNISSKST